MKFFKWIIIGILTVIVILVAISYMLPSKYTVSRSVYINSPDSIIYNLTSNLNKWRIWTTWTKEMDSTASFKLEGEDGKVGAVLNWNGKIMGDGKLTITETDPNRLSGYDLSYDEGKYQSKGKILIEPVGDSIKVTWINEGDLGYNPVSRFYGLTMDKMMGPDFEKGLQKLKKVAEERKDWPAMEEKIIPEQIVLLINDSAGPETYGAVLGKGYSEIVAFISKNKLTTIGHPFAIYLKWDSVTMFSVMDIGIAVERAENATGRIRIETIPEHKAIVTKYFGPYDKTAPYYYAMEKYCAQEGKEITGGPWEIYVSDPMIEKDPMKVQTDIVFPIK